MLTLQLQPTGTISQWGEVSKAKKTTKPKARDSISAATSIDSATAPTRAARGGRVLSEAGRGRGRATDRGARSARGRSAQPSANGTKNKENHQLSVPTEESSAYTAEEVKAKTAEPTPPPAASQPASSQGKTWASMLRQSTTPQSIPKPKEAPAQIPTDRVEPVPVAELSEPEPVDTTDETTPVAERAVPAEPAVIIPEIALPPSKDELTKTNLEQVVDDSKPPATATAASTAADSWDPRQNLASATATPLSAAQQQHQAQQVNALGFAAAAAKGPAVRGPAYHRRVLAQEEPVRMPGGREVDRAAVQFGAFSLADGDEDIDGDREEPQTRAQPPADSPVAPPRASLPPVVQASAVPDSLQQKSAAASSGTVEPAHKTTVNVTDDGAASAQPAAASAAHAPGSTQSMFSSYGSNKSQPSAPAHTHTAVHIGVTNAQQYGRFGQTAPQDVNAATAAQKPMDPFSQQQSSATQPPFEHIATPTSQPQSSQPGGAFTSAPGDYSSYYTASQQERNPYNYYGQQYGHQQQQHGVQAPQEGLPSHPRGYGGYNAQSDNLSQYPQSGVQSQPRFGGAANESQHSGHSTPNPPSAQNPQQALPAGQQPAAGPGAQPQTHGGQYPGYGHPYYNNPYYHHYYSGYGQGGFGPYGKGGMYGQPYGMSPSGPFDHTSSPAAFGQSSLHRDGGLGTGLGDYGRAGSGQAGAQPGLGGSGFGSVHDSFARGTSSLQSQGQPGGSATDELKPFGEGAKPAAGPSPSIGGARPGSATNNAPGAQGGGLPPAQSSQMGSSYGGYPSHVQGHGGSGYGMGAGAGAGQHGSSPYGSYGQFSSGGYYGGGGQQQRGGWGGNYH